MGATTDRPESPDSTRENLRYTGGELGLPVEELTDDDLLQAVLSAPGGEKTLIANDRAIHAAPRALFQGLARSDGYVDSGEDWIAFNADDAYVEATVKPGSGALSVLSIDLYLLRSDDRKPSLHEVQQWVARQQQPVLGLLTAGSREDEDGNMLHHPLIVIDVVLDGIAADFVAELLAPYAAAWDETIDVIHRKNAFCGPGGSPYRVEDPSVVGPTNAWLLVGTESSYPSAQQLDDMWTRAAAGIYDSTWTAPKTGRKGDLVFLYFLSPRKAACFVGRLASDPFWRTDVEAAADKDVDQHQWWAHLGPLVEVRPISFAALQKAAGGHLLLRGRSGHYLTPEFVDALDVAVADVKDEAELERIMVPPQGDPRLPAPESTTIEQWTGMPSGAMRLEADVSRHVVRPLQHLVYGPEWAWTRENDERTIEPALGPVIFAEMQVPSGFVDFGFNYPASTVALAVEVKLRIRRPPSGQWVDSADFRQLLRYMRDLDAPGLLVDAERILLVHRDDDHPFVEILRSGASWRDIGLIRDLMLEKADAGPDAPRGKGRRTLRRT